jgi:hypothetical protein
MGTRASEFGKAYTECQRSRKWARHYDRRPILLQSEAAIEQILFTSVKIDIAPLRGAGSSLAPASPGQREA